MPPYPIPFDAINARHESDALSNRLLSRRSGTTTTSEAATEFGLELARRTALGLLARITAAVAVTVAATVAAVTAASSTAASTGTVLAAAEHAPGRSRALLLDVGLGNDLGGEVEPLAEVVEALRSEGVVVVLP
jgi:hypothetical protein